MWTSEVTLSPLNNNIISIKIVSCECFLNTSYFAVVIMCVNDWAEIVNFQAYI